MSKSELSSLYSNEHVLEYANRILTMCGRGERLHSSLGDLHNLPREIEVAVKEKNITEEKGEELIDGVAEGVTQIPVVAVAYETIREDMGWPEVPWWERRMALKKAA